MGMLRIGRVHEKAGTTAMGQKDARLFHVRQIGISDGGNKQQCGN